MDSLNHSSDTSISQKFAGLQKRLAMILFSLVLVFVAIQFVVLAVIGVRGNEISALRSLQEQKRIENEILRATVMKSQVSTQIKESVEGVLGMKEVSPKVIDVSPALISAAGR